MRGLLFVSSIVAVAVGASSGCAPAASAEGSRPAPRTAHAAARVAPLIPRDVLFAGTERSSPELSPDGAKMSWLAPSKDGVMNVWAGPVGGAMRPVTRESHRPISAYAWSGDGSRILYFQDGDGDENDHVFSADLDGGDVRDLTPHPGVKAQNLAVSVTHPDHVLVSLNLRDRHVFDVYRIDLRTFASRLEAENPGDVLSFATDGDFVVRAATAFDPATARTVIRVRDAASLPWRDLVVTPFERSLFDGQVVNGSLVASFAPDGKSLYVHSASNQDHGRLVRVDAKTGAELQVVASDPRSDVADDPGSPAPSVVTHPKTGAIQAVEFEHTTPRWAFLDAEMAADFGRIEREARGFVRVVSRDAEDRAWIVSASRSDAPTAYLRYDRATKKVTPLFTDAPALLRYDLAAKEPVVIRARDGLELVSYLTVPRGAKRAKLPLVLLIHGGPWFRDRDGYEPEVQLLANRGYAVLQVNYRGSTGFGLSFLNASTHEWGRGTQEDLYDAVRWAVAQGIADPARVCAMGWSGGGYATLRALSMRPDLFACGVDGVGPADIATLFHSFPAYWGGILTRWRLRVGDPERDADLNRAISPLYHVDAIRAPLLIGQGANDPRVTIANADAMVKALRAAGRSVDYVVYPDEGHGFARPENNVDFYARVEEFLAKHLGGRAEPRSKVSGATAEVR